jgi:tetratricopeptide (TPR) repeat protein
MAVQGISAHVSRLQKLPAGTIAFGAAAAAAALLSLAAALLAFTGGATSAPSGPSAAEELALRNERIRFFEQRAAADSIDFVSLNVLAWEYLQRARETGDVGDYTRAETAAIRSLSIVPRDNFSGKLALAAVKLVQHDFAAGLGLSDEALALKPASAAAHGLRSDALVGLGRYEEADAALQKMLELEAGEGALSRLAGLSFLEGDLLNAEDFWRQAIDRSAGMPAESRAWTRTQLGGLYLSQGDLRRAEREYNEALKTYPDFAHAVAGLAAVSAAQERWDEAIALYESVQQRQPQTEYVIALGDVYAKSGRPADAASQYALVEAIARLYEANGIGTELQLALYHADHGDAARALALAEAAYEASPSVYAADAYAWALSKTGRLSEAATVASEATRFGTPEARFYYHAGLIRLALGDRQGAVAGLERALEINPYFAQADETRIALEKAKAPS